MDEFVTQAAGYLRHEGPLEGPCGAGATSVASRKSWVEGCKAAGTVITTCASSVRGSSRTAASFSGCVYAQGGGRRPVLDAGDMLF